MSTIVEQVLFISRFGPPTTAPTYARSWYNAATCNENLWTTILIAREFYSKCRDDPLACEEAFIRCCFIRSRVLPIALNVQCQDKETHRPYLKGAFPSTVTYRLHGSVSYCHTKHCKALTWTRCELAMDLYAFFKTFSSQLDMPECNQRHMEDFVLMPQLTYASQVTDRNRIYPKPYTEYKGRALEPRRCDSKPMRPITYPRLPLQRNTLDGTPSHIYLLSVAPNAVMDAAFLSIVGFHLFIVRWMKQDLEVEDWYMDLNVVIITLTRPSPPQRILLFPLNPRPMVRIITHSSTLVRLLGLYNTPPPSGPNSNQRGKHSRFESKGAY